ncbi:MAG: PepSY domain-containing protein, partial [Telluria sp.]
MKRVLIFVHKWLGVALALLFLMWFASGIVLYFVPFPSLTQGERLAGMASLELGADCCLGAQDAAARAGLTWSEARLGMHAGSPVWRLLTKDPERRWRVLDARSGKALAPLDTAAAVALAEAFSGRRARGAEVLERDQWTVAQGLNPHRPLVRVELDDPDGLELYVSPHAAEVVVETRRGERLWNWVGAVPHWIYFTELRRWPERWHNVVLGLSLPGVVLAASGLVLGIWQLYLNRTRWIPYRKFWMRWHHILGLAASVVALTWILSGLLSMNPFGVFSARGATSAERDNWLGARAAVIVDPAEALRLAAPFEAVEIDLLQLDGQLWYRIRGKPGAARQQLLVR